jgi:AraC family transcriptional regulator of adaptative response/methylated-DNA-[protein]-cysteine methyltransferase
MVDRVRVYIEDNLDKKLTLSILSAQTDISPFHLQRTFKRIVGVSPREYIQVLRLAKMKRSLLNGETVSRAIYGAGFSSRSRFYESGSHKFGMSAGIMRRGGSGMQISYAIARCPLGWVLVGGTKFGVCAVCMGNTEEEVEKALSEQFPNAIMRRDDLALAEWVSQIMRYFAGQEPNLNLPLDIQATAFQWRVWREIKSIPYGTTRSYSQIANALGNTQATRAVARACAANPVALIVPCHRVIGEDGEMHGYRWGKSRKQQLLGLEQRTKT